MTSITRQSLTHILDHQHVIAIRRLPYLPGVLRAGIRNQELVAVLPGIYARATSADEPLVRMAALHARDPDTVFTGLSAAALIWDLAMLPRTVTATGRTRATFRGYRLSQRTIDPGWIIHRGILRCTAPELTAVDLIPDVGARFVDQVLRDAGGKGHVALKRMRQALADHPYRSGNNERRSVLTESRDIPWSEAERRGHRLLRQSGITGWTTNLRVSAGNSIYYIDIAFPELMLAIEIDGYEHHSSRTAFEHDRRKHNDLVRSGWTVLHFTWVTLDAMLPTIRPWLESRDCGPGL